MIVNTDEVSLTRPPLTSCWVAWFLMCHRWVLVHGLGVGDPCYRLLCSEKSTKQGDVQISVPALSGSGLVILDKSLRFSSSKKSPWFLLLETSVILGKDGGNSMDRKWLIGSGEDRDSYGTGGSNRLKAAKRRPVNSEEQSMTCESSNTQVGERVKRSSWALFI